MGHSETERTSLPQIPGYEIKEVLGQGGMGCVYKAWQPKLRRWVAIKQLKRSSGEDPLIASRFDREMAAIGQLDHPHLVRAHDAGEVGGEPYLVMEFLTGRDAGWLEKVRGPLRIEDACEIVRQAALGMQSAYERGLVHRDLKPSNLMVTEAGLVKVLDLGLALVGLPEVTDQTAAVRELTETGQVMGTIDYMAPEQADDSHLVDIRADVYSLGATLYKLLTRQAPFSHVINPAKKLMLLVSQPVRLVTELRPDIPAALAELLGRLLEKSPHRRLATPAELAECLQPFCAGADLRELVTGVPQQWQSSSALHDINAATRTEALPGEATPSNSLPQSLPQRRGQSSLSIDGESPGVTFITAARSESGDAPSVRNEPLSDKRDASTHPRPWMWSRVIASVLLMAAVGFAVMRFRPETLVVEPPPQQAAHKVAEADATTNTPQVPAVQPPVDIEPMPVKQAESDVLTVDWTKTRSQLDDLDPSQIPNELRTEWQPKELVGLIGDERWTTPFRIGTILFSADAKAVVLWGPYAGDGLAVWDVDSMRQSLLLPPLLTDLYMSAQLSDRSTLNLVTQQGEFQRWSRSNNQWQKRVSVKMSDRHHSSAISADGKVFALIDAATPPSIVTGTFPPIEGQYVTIPITTDMRGDVQLSADGRILVVTSGGRAIWWDRSQTPPKELGVLNLRQGPSPVDAPMKLAGNGQILVYQLNGRIGFWNLNDNTKFAEERNPGSTDLHLSFDGSRGTWGSGVASWFQQTEKKLEHTVLTECYTDSWTPAALAIAPQGDLIAAMENRCRLKLWKIEGDKPVLRNPSPSVFAQHLAFAADSTLGVTAAQGYSTWRVLQGRLEVLQWLEREPHSDTNPWRPHLQFDPLEKLPALLVHGHKGDPDRSWPQRNDLSCWSFYPHDSRYDVHGDRQGLMRLVDGVTKTDMDSVQAHDKSIGWVQFSPSGRRLLSATDGFESIRLWNVADPRTLSTTTDLSARHLGASGPFRPSIKDEKDGKDQKPNRDKPGDAAPRSAFTPLKEWKPNEALRSEEPLGLDVALSDDDQLMAIKSRRGVWLWRLKDELPTKLPLAFNSAEANRDSLAFSPDGKWLAVGGLAGEQGVILWDIAAGRVQQQWKTHGSTREVKFAPDGRHLAWINANQSAYVLRLAPAPDGKRYEPSLPEIHLRPEMAARTPVGWDSIPTGLRPVGWDSIPTNQQRSDGGAGKNPNGKLEDGSGKIPNLRALSAHAIVTQPTPIKSLKSWSVESTRHRGGIAHAAYSPDGKWVATIGTWDRTVRVWDAETYQLRHCWNFHSTPTEAFDYAQRVQWTPDSKQVISLSPADGHIAWWELESQKLVKIRTLPEPPLWSPGHTLQPALSPNGRYVASGIRDVVISDTETGEVLRGLPSSERTWQTMNWSPDSALIATRHVTNSEHIVKVWDASTGKLRHRLTGHTNYINGVAWSPDGRRLATGSADKTVRFWNVDTGANFKTLTEQNGLGSVGNLEWANDGASLLIRSGDGYILWDLITGEKHRETGGPIGPHSIRHPKGRHYLFWNAFWPEHVQWDPTTNQTQRLDLSLYLTEQCEVSPDATRCFIHMGGLTAWDLQSNSLLGKMNGIGALNGFNWTRDGKAFVGRGHGGDRDVTMWEFPSGQVLRNYGKGQLGVLSPDQTLVACVLDNSVAIRDAQTMQVLKTMPCSTDMKSQATRASWSFDGRYLVVSGYMQAQWFDVAQGKQLTEGVPPLKDDIHFSPTSNQFFMVENGGLAVFDWPSGKQLRRVNWGGDARTRTAGWSPDGRWIANQHRSNVQLLEADTLQTQFKCPTPSHSGPWVQCRFTPNSQQLVTNYPLQWWDVKTGRLLKTLWFLSDSRAVMVEPTGHYHASPGAESDLIYTALTDDNQHLTLTPAEFTQRFGWKNDSTKVK